MQKHFLSIAELSRDEIFEIFDLARDLKNRQKRGQEHKILAGKTLAMIFQKPSARTRVSFEVGMFQLGGHALYLGPNDIQIGKRESISDVARTLSRFVDIIMARMFGHADIVELAEFASVPVINGLTDLLHPCQIMADLFTILEHRQQLEDLKITYIGDGNNVANSWLNMATRVPMTLNLAIPEEYDPPEEILAQATSSEISHVQIFRNPAEACEGCHVLYTDVWASMGQEAEAEQRKKAFRDFQVNQALLQRADPKCLVMHCLPAHRGEEITDEVIEGPRSVVFDEAENRLHVQKAILVKLLE
ncbi:MAG: ornithine carbamoyltransferase [bacterium]